MGKTRVERVQQQLRSALCSGDVQRMQLLLGFQPEGAASGSSGNTLWRKLTSVFKPTPVSEQCMMFSTP